MHQFRVELRTPEGGLKRIDVTADNHQQAVYRAHRQTGLTVLSTELID